MSLCHFDLRKCVTSPDALALKDHDMGQLTSLKVALCSLWACLLPGTAAFDLSPMPCAAQALAGKDSSSHQPYGELVCAGIVLSMAS